MTLVVSTTPLLTGTHNPSNGAAVCIRENSRSFVIANVIIATYGAVLAVLGNVSKDRSLEIYLKPVGWGLVVLGSIFGETVRRSVVREAAICWEVMDCYFRALGCAVIPMIILLSVTEIHWSAPKE